MMANIKRCKLEKKVELCKNIEKLKLIIKFIDLYIFFSYNFFNYR